MDKRLKIFDDLLRKHVDRVPRVNYGGCGFVAKYLHKSLKEVGFKPKVVLLTHEFDSADDLIYAYKRGHDYEAAIDYLHISHFVIKAGGRYIDSTGVFDKIEDVPLYEDECAIEFPPTLLDVLLSKDYAHNWNDMFERSNVAKIRNGVKTIEKKVKKHLEKSK